MVMLLVAAVRATSNQEAVCEASIKLGEPLFSLYSASIQALFSLYSGSIQTLLPLYSGSIQALFRLY
jgi:hypothetical protein